MKLKPHSINWAVRSRISDLRKKGFNIQSRIGVDGCAEYKLVQADQNFPSHKIGLQLTASHFTVGVSPNTKNTAEINPVDNPERPPLAQVKFEGEQSVMVL